MRIFYYDNIKGLLILCVILGHVLSICSTYFDYNYSFFKIITFFMVPLFIFITGIFAKRSKKTPLKRAIKMLTIFIIAQLLITIYYAYILGIISPAKSIFLPRFTLWYLLTCASLYLLEYIFRKFKFKYVFIISISFALLSGFISIVTNYLSLSRTIAYLPFFILGYYKDEIHILDFIKKYQKPITIFAIIISIWFFLNQGFFSFKDTYLKYNYYVYDTPIECFFKRGLFYIFSFIFSAFILNIIPKEKTVFSKLSKDTLMLYLIHGVLLKTLLHFSIFTSNKVIGTIITYIIVLIISLLLGYIINKIIRKGAIYVNKIKFIITKKSFKSIQEAT